MLRLLARLIMYLH